MSSHNFPKRGPRVMNGMARMLAQAHDLTSVAQASRATARSVNMAGQLQASIEVLKQVKIAKQQVANVQTCLESFTEQCKLLPEDDAMRKVVEVLITTVRQAIEAGAEGKAVTVAVSKDDGPQQA